MTNCIFPEEINKWLRGMMSSDDFVSVEKKSCWIVHKELKRRAHPNRGEEEMIYNQ